MIVLNLDPLQIRFAVVLQDLPENYPMSFPLKTNHNLFMTAIFPRSDRTHNAHVALDRVTVTRPKLTW